LVVAAGLVISNVRVGFGLPWAALRSMGNFDIDPEGDLFGPGREVGDAWEWHGQVKPSQQVWIRNTNGPVAVVQGTGDMLAVTAEKSWRHSEPNAVELVPVTSERGVTICALWVAHERRCGAEGEYELHGVRKNDVAVRFTVHLPRGVKVDVSTMNGEVAIEGAAAPVVANTLNGRILVRTSVGPVRANTVNGSIEAAMDALTGGDIELGTVNGGVTVMLPSGLNAVVDASTVNGRVETDFPLALTGKISPRHMRGTIGSGGMTLKLNTVNGSVTIRRADGRSADVTPEAPVAPRAPHPPHPLRARRAAPTPRP
jgi:ribosomal protein S28E/S33